MDVFKISTTNQKHKQTNSKAKIKEPRCEKRLGLLANELKRPMCDTIFKRNLNKFLCDCLRLIVYIFIIVFNFYATHCF